MNTWLEGDDPSQPPPPSRQNVRNQHWRHLNSLRVMSVPDKWEYPWFAAWDLAFHCVGYALVDPRYAMDQLWFLLFEQFQHPNGQIPAYEWEFSDTNPPVHAWAVWRVYNMARVRSGHADRAFLERCFHKLLINFAWWINKVDQLGNNVFEGGFLGLDNITVIDRSNRFSDGSVLEQSDGSGWMGMFCLNMMRIALELARENPVYEGLATKFFQHYVYVAAAMKHMGNRPYALWDDRDGFFYDVLRRPDQSFQKFRVRSLVGLVPLFAVERLEQAWIEPFVNFRRNLDWFLSNRRDLVEGVVHTVNKGGAVTHVLTIVNDAQLGRILERVLGPGRVPFRLRHPQPFQDPRSASICLRRAGCRLRAGRGDHEDQGGKLELARPDLVPDLLPVDRVAAQAGHGVRPRGHAGTARASRAAHHFRRNGAVAGRAADPDLRTRSGDRPPCRSRRRSASSRKIPTGTI